VTSPFERRPALVFALLAGYFLLNVAVRLMMPASLELDEGQQIFLSQWLSAGYDTQPPFYNWLQYGVISLLGVSVASLTLLKNAFLFTSYLLLGLTAFDLLRDKRLAVVAALSLLTIPQISFEAQRDLTHTVAVVFAACLFLFGLFRTLRKPSAGSYLLTGAAIGIGIISKYNFVLLPAAALLAILPDLKFRRHLFDWRILLTAATALVIVLPHALWFLDHMQEATSNTLGKMTDDAPTEKLAQIGRGLLNIVVALASFATVTCVIFAVFGKALFAALRIGNEWTRLIERMWFFAIVALVSLVLFLGVVEIRDRWLTPLFLSLPLYLCLKLDAAGVATARPFRRFLAVALVIMAIVPAVLAGRIVSSGWTGSYDKLNVPYGPLVENLVRQSPTPPGLIIAGDVQLAGSIRLHTPDIPVAAPQYRQFSPAPAPGRPTLVVWRERRSGKLVPEMPDTLAALVTQKAQAGENIEGPLSLSLPYHYGAEGDVYTFSYVWLRPAGS
jgi:4-amino-4-deoxy-L-arabinose transferase-like glycosyltransferase